MDDKNLRPGEKFSQLLTRDPVVSIMFGIAIALVISNLSFVAIVAHTHHIEILEIPMLATGAFALAGIVLGLVRSARNGARKRT